MHNKIKLIRWVLVIPVASIGWYLAIFLGILLYSFADALCPPEQMVSGFCEASWHRHVIEGLFVLCSFLAAVFIVTFATLVAPNKRILVSRVAFVTGVFCAAYAVYLTHAWGSFVGAIMGGALSLYLLLGYLNSNGHA